jgi:hypothetical protein
VPVQEQAFWALRVRPSASASDWWSAASRRRDAPAAIGALLRGRSRIELSEADAVAALAWAGDLEGWAAAEPKPVFIHQPDHEHS